MTFEVISFSKGKGEGAHWANCRNKMQRNPSFVTEEISGDRALCANSGNRKLRHPFFYDKG